VLAALFHEISHFAAIYLTGGKVIGISIGGVGAKMETLPMSRGREVLCALAGPVGSLLLALGLPFLPEMALCALVQGLYNLIPVYPLDGGRILRCLLPSSVCAGIEVFAIILLLGCGIWCCFSFDLGIIPVIPGLAAAMRSVTRKIPCKESRIAVQ
jgi:stage IV sporulation protein FB